MARMNRAGWVAIAAAAVFSGAAVWLLVTPPAVAGGKAITVYKSPTCGCCTKWVDLLSERGFEVETIEQRNLAPVKAAQGVPRQLASCHTALIEGYVVEGHVPIADIERLLRERPALSGIAVPGMPIGSPGMEGPNPERYEVIGFDASGKFSVFATHGPGA